MARLTIGLLILGGFFVLLSSPDSILAQKGANTGTIKSVDKKTGTVTINMLLPVPGSKKKKELGDKEFLLPDDAKVTVVEGSTKTTMTGKEAIEKGVIKEGMTASFTPDDLKLKELTVGAKK